MSVWRGLLWGLVLLGWGTNLWAKTGGGERPWFMDERQGWRFGEAKLLRGDEALPKLPQAPLPAPARDEAEEVALVGETTVIGYTYYDYQHNGTIGKMIVRDSEGGIHVVYMKGYDAQQATRHMWYNFMDENGNWLFGPNEPSVIDNGTRSGYGVVSVLPEDNRGMAFYHVLGHLEQDPNYTATAQSADFARGFGAFSPSYPPAWANSTLIWPKGAISRNNITHILATENVPQGQLWQRLAYWRGEPDRAFENWRWLDPPILVDTVGVIGAMVAASRTSNKVAMAWHHNRVGANLGRWEGFGGAWQRNNDLRYIVSTDGRNFDWQRGVRSMTKIIPIDPELANLDPIAAMGDTFRPYTDVDIEFDPWGNDGLYAAFAVCGFWENPDLEGDPVTGVTGEHDYLLFWNGQRDTITFVYNGWYFNRTNNGGAWHSRTGAWRMNADRPSIAFHPEDRGTIYLVWVNFPKIQELNPRYNEDPQNEPPFLYNEDATDTSAAGYNNAEIMVSISTDSGITWRQPINITGTRWREARAPEPGQCASENWPSVAVWVDDALHILYIKDTDAGGIPQNEGTATNSPVVYHRVPLDELDLNDPVELPTEGWIFHNYPQARPQIDESLVRREPGVPVVNQAVRVTATVLPGGDNQLTEVVLLYALNGGEEQAVNMERVQGDLWAGTIPGQSEGTVVWYRVRATNSAGFTTYAPFRNWRYAYTVRPPGGLKIRDIQYRPSQWEVDYSPYRGYEVTVTGIVTTPASFARMYDGYAIQDTADEWSGVIVRGIREDLNVGDRIRVTGIVYERDPMNPTKWEFATYIQVSQYEVLGQADPIRPILVRGVSDLTFAQRAENLEACLVRLIDFEIDTLEGLDLNTTLYWPLEDQTGDGGWMTAIGLTPEQIQAMGLRNLRQGSRITSAIGVFTENYGHYALALRSPQDLGPVEVKERNIPAPYRYALHPVYPNPFNARATVSFDLARDGFTRLALYDVSGRWVTDLVQGELKAGRHSLVLDASALPTGIYLLKLESAGVTRVRKVALVR